MFFDEMLVEARQQISEAPTLPLTLANAQYITITNEIPLGHKAYTFRQMTRYGVAQVITTRSTNVPLVADSFDERTVNVFPIRLAFQLEQDDIELAESNNVNIATKEFMTVRDAIDMKLDNLAYEGEPGTTLQGLATNSNITSIDLPADGNSNGGTNSVEWRHKTPEQVLRDLNIIAIKVPSQTGNTVFCNRLLLPMDKLNFLATTPYNPSTGVSILTIFLQNQAQLPFGGITEVIGHPSLETAGTGGVGRVVAYNSSSRFNRLHIPQGGGFRDTPPERNGTTLKFPCQMKTAGVEIERIKEVAYANVS